MSSLGLSRQTIVPCPCGIEPLSTGLGRGVSFHEGASHIPAFFGTPIPATCIVDPVDDCLGLVQGDMLKVS